MKTGSRGLALIKDFEKCKLVAYKDGAGVWTIGWGHTDSTIKYGTVWTQIQADNALALDLKTAENCINTAVRFRLNQSQFDALVAFTFNVGISAFANSTMRRLLNEGKPELAAKQFVRWNKITVNGALEPSDGLTRRRAAEQQLFESQP